MLLPYSLSHTSLQSSTILPTHTLRLTLTTTPILHPTPMAMLATARLFPSTSPSTTISFRLRRRQETSQWLYPLRLIMELPLHLIMELLLLPYYHLHLTMDLQCLLLLIMDLLQHLYCLLHLDPLLLHYYLH